VYTRESWPSASAKAGKGVGSRVNELLDSQLISLLTVVRIRLVLAGTAGSSTTSWFSSSSSSEDNAALRLAFMAEEWTRVLVRAALSMETMAAAAVSQVCNTLKPPPLRDAQNP
jgi:hypothetical protein